MTEINNNVPSFTSRFSRFHISHCSELISHSRRGIISVWGGADVLDTKKNPAPSTGRKRELKKQRHLSAAKRTKNQRHLLAGKRFKPPPNPHLPKKKTKWHFLALGVVLGHF